MLSKNLKNLEELKLKLAQIVNSKDAILILLICKFRIIFLLYFKNNVNNCLWYFFFSSYKNFQRDINYLSIEILVLKAYQNVI